MKSAVRHFFLSLTVCLCLVAGGALQAQTSIISGTPPNGAVNNPYNFTFRATGPNCSAPPTFDWTVQAPGLPAWLNLTLNNDSTATVSGTPPAAGPVSFTIEASDNSCSDSPAQQDVTIAI